MTDNLIHDLTIEAIAQKESKEKAYSLLEHLTREKAYLLSVVMDIARICETDPDNSDLKKIRKIIREMSDELEVRFDERAVHHQSNHVQCNVI